MQICAAVSKAISECNEEVNTDDDGARLPHLDQAIGSGGVVDDHAKNATHDGRSADGDDTNQQAETKDERAIAHPYHFRLRSVDSTVSVSTRKIR